MGRGIAMKRIIVGVSGASGAQLAYHVLKALRAQDAEIHLILFSY